MAVFLLFVGFWVFQLLANYFFKYGSVHKELWIACFLIGNVFGASSIWFVMKLYLHLSANIAAAISGGVTFILVQLMFLFFFRERPSLVQWAGISIILVGVTIASLGGQPAKKATSTPLVEQHQVSGLSLRDLARGKE